MSGNDMLAGKRILIVDDEPDVLETLEALLSKCVILRASNFTEARELLENQSFDAVILDIMGVDGYALLEIANTRRVPAIMLTANALSLENTVKSFKKGAASYVPKDEMPRIALYLNDIFEAKDKGKHLAWRWIDRLTDYYNSKFGLDWQNKERDFWERFPHI